MYTISIRNMTQVNSAEILIYSDQTVDPAYKAEVADLKMEEGSAGTLTLKIPVGNAGYNSLEELSTQVIVRKDTVTNNPDKVYWIGRLLNVNIDFHNSKELTFEGAFNYLMDTIQLPSKSNCKLELWVDFLLNRHNTICETSGEYYKKVYKGVFDQAIDQVSHELYTNYETTQEMINNAIQYDESHVFYRYQYDSTHGCWNLYLDFRKEYYNAGDSTPVISFGQNLMDYTRTYEPDELATVIIPRGDRYSDDEWYNATHVVGGPNKEDINAPEELDHYFTVWSCATAADHTLNEYTVYASQDMQNRFGYVSKIVDFDGVRNYDTLISLARNYLTNQKWIKLTLEISAVDLKMLSPGLQADTIAVGYMIHCISIPHGLNYYYPCISVDENLLDVGSSNYTLGTGDTEYLTDAARKSDEKLKELVKKNAERERVLTDNILHKPVNAFTNIKDAIDDVERMSEDNIVTVKTEAKRYAVNLLNVYDSLLNSSEKGYVHFLTEKADYTEGAVISIGDIKNRLERNFSSNTQLAQIDAILQDMYDSFDNPDYVWVVFLGNQDAQVCIAKYANSYKYNSAGDAYLWYYNSTGIYQNIGYVFLYTYYSNWSTYHSLKTNTGNVFQYRDPDSGEQRPSYSGQYYDTFSNNSDSSYWRLPYPTKKNIDDQTNYKFYCNRNVYESSSSSNVYLEKNIEKKWESFSYNTDHITEIVISRYKDYMDPGTIQNPNWVWRWNQYGLYALQGSYNPNFTPLPDGTYQNPEDTIRLALTYDGDIVADRITVGILNADVVKTGVIRSRPVGTAEPDGNMMIDIPNGNIIAKKGTLIFNDVREVQTVPAGKKVTPLDGFIYISNINAVDTQGTPLLMNVGGEQKNDWRIVSGDSFGVDSGGRTYMREGIIGATGGEFSVVGRNSSFVRCTHYTSDSNYKWTVNFNTDASRPLFSENASEVANFRFRIAHYGSNNTLEFVSKLFSFIFPVGKEAVSFTEDFYPVVPYSQGSSVPYTEGELFPIWYSLNDSATEDYYEQDGHRYTMYNSDGNVITPSSSDPPKYTTYTNTRTQSGGTNAGSVVIGSGYLANGTFGQNRSFYLGGIKRSGTVANNTRDDWRFAVGSRFGVTENGNLYCTDMYARDAHLRGGYLEQCTVTGSITATKLTNLSLKSSNPVESSSSICTIRWRINIDPTTYGGGMFDSDTDFYMMVDANSELATPNVSPTFKFTVMSEEFPIGYPSGEHTEKLAGEFTFTYDKNGTSGVAQRKSINTSSWDNPSSGKELVKKPNQSDGDVELTVLVEMTTSETSSFKFIGSTQLKTYPTQVVEGADGWTYIEGYVQVAKVNSTPRPAVQCGADFVGGSSKWLGGPSLFWAKAYVSETIRTVSGNGSSKLYKENIEPLNGRYSELFDKLKPVRYNFRKEIYDDDGKYHTGFIMEDIGESMKQLDISEDEFAAYNPDHENGGGNVRYDELIALAVDEIHTLKHRVSELEKQLYEQGIIVTDD